ncbi:MAG: hypothetical protein V1792_12735 [Pseudomonadota bacterium]
MPGIPAIAAVLFICLLAAIGPDQCRGLEIKLKGEYTWSYSHISQMGPNGFFGVYDIDNASPEKGGAASINGWHGTGNFTQTSSSTSSACSGMSMSINADFELNPAIKISGSYYIGTWAYSPNESGVQYPVEHVRSDWSAGADVTGDTYSTMTSPGIGASFSPGYWNTLWVEAQTPWGRITVGKRGLVFGTGLMFNGEDNTSTETVQLEIPLGSPTIGIGWYPWRRRQDQVYVELKESPGEYYNPLDTSSGRQYDLTGWVTYGSGPLSTGILAETFAYRFGPESVNKPSEKKRALPGSSWAFLGGAFVRYFNGRWFFNAEADWFYETTMLKRNMEGNLKVLKPVDIQGALSDDPRFYHHMYIEHWRYMVEMGAILGPTRMSVILAWIPGPDRRHGILIDRQPSFFDDQYTNTGLFNPYSVLLVSGYGTGNNSMSQVGSGYLSDAFARGIRIDYAPAANLNAYMRFFLAQRLSHGYGWGFIRPALKDNVGTGSVDYRRRGTLAKPAPAVPDSDLGYEIGVGALWELLAGYRLEATFSLFQPGDWFKFACMDRSNPSWKKNFADPHHDATFGINPDRKIDPIFELDVSLTVSF